MTHLEAASGEHEGAANDPKDGERERLSRGEIRQAAVRPVLSNEHEAVPNQPILL